MDPSHQNPELILNGILHNRISMDSPRQLISQELSSTPFWNFSGWGDVGSGGNFFVLHQVLLISNIADPNPDVWTGSRSRSHKNDPISTVLVCAKAMNTAGILVV
jgi:hypothetical protein